MRTPLLPRFALAALGLSALAAACSAGPDTDSTPRPGDGDPEVGAQLYAEMCASCHGNTAEGGLGPRLSPWTKSLAALVDSIETTMPKGEPEKCDRSCAEDIAAFLTGLPTGCDGPRALPRRLRLLTRREYRATVADLFQASMAAACQSDSDCDLAHESCTGGVCTKDPCDLHTFLYDAGASTPATVHVSGSFNGWPGTVAAGGWPMQKVPGTTTYYAKHTLSTGTHEYKLVLDESQWIADPANPQQTGEFGNSVLTLACGARPGGPGAPFASDPAKDFPAESRPTGFPFDSSDGALATGVHVDQYWKAAALLADAALADLENLLPCDIAIDPEACAQDFVADFGKRAFRRPLSEAERSKYTAELLSAPDTTTGIRIVLRTMLSSPYFLYRSEIGEPLGDGTFRLTPHETATVLSYTFWGTTPDDALLAAADDGSLATPAGIESQARRLLKDPKSRPVLDTFTVQWLGIEKVTSISKDPSLFPEWNDALAASMLEETRRFVRHTVFDGSRKLDDLFLAETTFADATLAGFYGAPAPDSPFAAVPSPENRKAGLLGHASILSSYSYSNQSSPILRGLFVRRNLLCQSFPAPPADAATIPPIDPDATTRERFDQHSSDPVCHTCHQYIDHLGFGFERFDAAGRYRETENGKPIDAAGDMNDIEALGADTHAPFDSLRGLGEHLAASKSARACFAKQTYRFAMGRLETADDACGLGELAAAFEAADGDIQELWIQLTKLDEFTRRK